MAMFLDYKPTRYEGKGFLRNLNIRIHRDITGDRCGLGWCRGVKKESNNSNYQITKRIISRSELDEHY